MGIRNLLQGRGWEGRAGSHRNCWQILGKNLKPQRLTRLSPHRCLGVWEREKKQEGERDEGGIPADPPSTGPPGWARPPPHPAPLPPARPHLHRAAPPASCPAAWWRRGLGPHPPSRLPPRVPPASAAPPGAGSSARAAAARPPPARPLPRERPPAAPRMRSGARGRREGRGGAGNRGSAFLTKKSYILKPLFKAFGFHRPFSCPAPPSARLAVPPRPRGALGGQSTSVWGEEKAPLGENRPTAIAPRVWSGRGARRGGPGGGGSGQGRAGRSERGRGEAVSSRTLLHRGTGAMAAAAA